MENDLKRRGMLIKEGNKTKDKQQKTNNKRQRKVKNRTFYDHALCLGDVKERIEEATAQGSM
jgi:hypothetical protein